MGKTVALVVYICGCGAKLAGLFLLLSLHGGRNGDAGQGKRRLELADLQQGARAARTRGGPDRTGDSRAVGNVLPRGAEHSGCYQTMVVQFSKGTPLQHGQPFNASTNTVMN